ncbi:MAG: hypothetical protein AAFN81_21945 [Bacteroidota bacterium]
MRKLVLVLVLQGIAFQIVAQSFPESWEGYWSGEVEIWGSGVQQGAFPMSLEIKPTDSLWTYIITYDHGRLPEPDIREYSLVILEDTLGHYAIDEHNSIVLDAYFMGGCLYSVFAGMGSQLQSRICRDGDELDYEITSFYEEPIRSSGDTVMGTDTIPPIDSHQVYNVMKASLSRKD